MDVSNRGQFSELRFTMECVRRGIKVSTPMSARSIYDLLVDVGSTIYRVQIKSHWKQPKHNNVFELDVRRHRRKNTSYQETEIDFMVVYVYHLDGFFIFPNKGMKTVSLNPNKSKYWQNFEFNL